MNKEPSNGPIKKGVKIAAMITTLGVSLGVNVDYIQAQDMPQGEVKRSSSELNQDVIQNTQHKIDTLQAPSTQHKTPSLQAPSNQHKIGPAMQAPSTQHKVIND